MAWWFKLGGQPLKQTVSLNILWPVKALLLEDNSLPFPLGCSSSLLSFCGVAICLIKALELQFWSKYTKQKHFGFSVMGISQVQTYHTVSFRSYATVFSPDPTLSRENRISNFKKTSFHCIVSECKITSEQQISLASLETHIKLIISYFTSAKQYLVFSWTLTKITSTHSVLGERDCPLVPVHQSRH